jgi:predicted acyl esterase
MTKEYMVADQRFCFNQTRVLVYESENMEENTTYTGAIQVKLKVSTSSTDADWIER